MTSLQLEGEEVSFYHRAILSDLIRRSFSAVSMNKRGILLMENFFSGSNRLLCVYIRVMNFSICRRMPKLLSVFIHSLSHSKVKRQ